MNTFIVVRAAHDDESWAVPIDNIAYIARERGPEPDDINTRIYLRHVAGSRSGTLMYIATMEAPLDVLERINAALKQAQP
jgi:hypothetical protein